MSSAAARSMARRHGSIGANQLLCRHDQGFYELEVHEDGAIIGIMTDRNTAVSCPITSMMPSHSQRCDRPFNFKWVIGHKEQGMLGGFGLFFGPLLQRSGGGYAIQTSRGHRPQRHHESRQAPGRRLASAFRWTWHAQLWPGQHGRCRRYFPRTRMSMRRSMR